MGLYDRAYMRAADASPRNAAIRTQPRAGVVTTGVSQPTRRSPRIRPLRLIRRLLTVVLLSYISWRAIAYIWTTLMG